MKLDVSQDGNVSTERELQKQLALIEPAPLPGLDDAAPDAAIEQDGGAGERVQVASAFSDLIGQVIKRTKTVAKPIKKEPLIIERPQPVIEPPPPGKPPAEPGTPEEAKRVLGLNLGDYDLDATHQINFDRIETTDDIKAVIADVAERNKASINTARRGKIGQEQLAALASELDVDTEVVQKVLSRESGGVLNPETILAARQVLNSSAERVIQLARKVQGGLASDTEKLSFRRQLDFHREYQVEFTGARAETGRALNAFKIPTATDATQVARMSELVETMHGRDVQDLAEALSLVDSVEGVNKIARDYQKSKALGVLNELFVNSILSGIKTHAINTGGNALFQTMGVAETAVAARLGRFLSGDEHVMVGEASAKFYGAISGWRDAMRLAGKAIKTGEVSDNVYKYEAPIRRAISSENLEISGTFGRAVDAFGTVIRFPTERMLTGEDEFFKTIGRRAEVARLAYREAAQQKIAQNLSDVETARIVHRLIENPPAQFLKQAEDAALYATFQNPLGPTGREIQGIVNRMPGLKFLAPFIRTPANIFKAAFVERTPLGLFSSRIRAEIAAGGPQRDLALARISMGTMTAASVALAAGSGMITGGGPSNPQARKMLEATGWQPYSGVITNPATGEVTYQSYARAEPLAFIIGSVADMVEITQWSDSDDNLTPEDDRIVHLTAAIVGGIAENTMSKTFISGLSRFNEALADPDRYFKSWQDSMTGAFIPFSALRRDLGKIQDPIIREAWTTADKLKATSGLASLSEGLPPALDMFGDVRYHPRGDLLGVLAPLPNKAMSDDPVKLDIASLMMETKRVPLTMPARRIEGMRLTADEYFQYVEASRKSVRVDGKNFYDLLDKTLNSSVYQNATPDSRIDLIKNVQQKFDELARATLYQKNQEFRDRLNRYRALKLEHKVGEDRLPPSIQNLIDTTR